MPLSDIVNVQITRETATVSQAGFGTLMILGTHKRFNDRIRFYSNLSSVAEDFSSTDKEYIAAQDVFSQSITPTQLAIGRRTVNSSTITVETAMSPFEYTVTINGTNVVLTDSTPTVEYSTVVLDADLVTSNSVAITVNGNAMTPIVYATSHDATMTAIAAAIALEPNIAGCILDPDDPTNRTLILTGDPNYDAIVDSFVVTLGASQATATITEQDQAVSKLTIADAFARTSTGLINVLSGSLGVVATDNGDGTFDVDASVSGTPFTLDVSTNIINPNEARVTITQAKPLTTYSVTIAGEKVSYTSLVDVQTNEEIASELVSLIDLNSNITVGVTDNLDGSFELDSASTFTLVVSENIMAKQFGLIIDPYVASSTVTDDLDAIVAVNDDWYALAETSRTQSVVEAIAVWIEARTKIFGTVSSDSDIIDVANGVDITSIAAVLNIAGYVRTFCMYHQDADIDFPECAWFGRMLPTTPGSSTWKFKQLASISYSDLTTTQSLYARNKQCNTFEHIGGVGITREGTMAQGEFIDVIRGIDWLQARIQEYVYQLLVNSDKVPYTNDGITAVEAEVKRALQQGIDNNFLTNDPSPLVSVPSASSVSSANKAARLLQDVTFTATLAGAIHAVEISGFVSI